MTTIFGTWFVGPAAARFAVMLAACAGLALTPAPASRQLDAPIELDVAQCRTPDSDANRAWRQDVDTTVSDACDDDDDDDGDDEQPAGSGPLIAGRTHFEPELNHSAHLGSATKGRRGSRGRDVYLLRGPPAVAMETSTLADDDTAGSHPIQLSCGVHGRKHHVPLLFDPRRSISAQSVYGLRAPP